MANEFNFVESETVELKSSLSEWQEIIETISAFSNAKGGTIYVGINPKGEVKGVDIGKRTLENLASDIKQYTDPRVFPTMEVGKIGERDVVIIRVKEYPTKPVWAKDKVYIRVGRSNQRASAEKIRDFINQNKTFKWDHQVQPTLKLSEIDTARVRLFLQKVEEERNTTFEGARTTGKILEKLKLLKEGSLTNASLLLFGKKAQEHFLQSEIRCARFNGIEPVDFADMQVINGTLIEQVPAVLNFIRRHINVAAQITGDPERKEIWEYPKEAVREAVVNAICHRSYDDTGNVQVRIFDDRLEVWNPGLLPGNITIEMLRRHHQSKPRNELIAKCFYLVKYIEQWGTGTNRMIKLCREGGLPGLEFYELADSFIVIFRRKLKLQEDRQDRSKSEMKLTRTQKRIIQFVAEKGEVSTSELVTYLGINRRSVQRSIRQLDGIVEWSGESARDPKGRYSLKKKR